MSFTSQEIEDFSSSVAGSFDYLRRVGFLFSQVATKEDPVAGSQLILELRRHDIGRGIRIKLLRSPTGDREAMTFFVEKGGRGGFSLDNYLKLKGVPEEQIERLDLKLTGATLSERIAPILRCAECMVDQYLVDALNGGTWPDVPVNWGQHR